MRRKPVIKLLRSIVKLRAVLRACGGDVARRLKIHVGRHPPALSGQIHSYEPVLRDFDDHLGAFAQLLAGAEDSYGEVKQRAARRRAARTRAHSSLHLRQRRTRQFLSGLPGVGERLESAAVTAATPQSAPELIFAVERTVGVLRALDPEAPDLAVVAKIDVTLLGRALLSRLEAFKNAWCAFEEADAALVAARDRADEALFQTRQAVGWVGGALENLCYLAAEPRIAERVRGCVGG